MQNDDDGGRLCCAVFRPLVLREWTAVGDRFRPGQAFCLSVLEVSVQAYGGQTQNVKCISPRDGWLERAFKQTCVQAIRFHVERNQKGWARALPKVRFDMLNTVNSSTGYTGFQLKTGHSPRLIPPLIPFKPEAEEVDSVHRAMDVLERLRDDVVEARDNLLQAKVSQAEFANRHRSKEEVYVVGQRVMLSTFHRRRDYLRKDEKRVAKFMPRYDGPYKVTKSFPATSTYAIDMPNHPDTFATFHASLLSKYNENNPDMFPSRVRTHPGTVVTDEGEVEWWIDKIIDERKRGRGYQYLVRWVGEGQENDLWLPRREVEDCEALTDWLKSVGRPDAP